jgi:hypothetical protein
MSMFVNSVSAYQQMQSWRSSQGAINNKILGSATDTVDNSSAFTSISSNMFANQATLAGYAALARVQTKVQQATATAGSTEHSGPTNAQARGQAILGSLGLSGAAVAAAYRTSAPSSANGPYKPPTDPATGHGYALTSASAMATLGAVNFLA